MADFVLTSQEIGRVVQFVAPGFFARLAYEGRFPRAERTSLNTIIWSVAASLPLVALSNQLAGWFGIRIDATSWQYVAVLLTPALLVGYAVAAQAVRADGRNDVVFVQADAMALPFPDAHFDVVVSRFAMHHFNDIGAALREMGRVCTPCGSVTVVDMVTETGLEGERMDELERLRDPSHVACLSPARLRELVADAGLRPVAEAHRDERLGPSNGSTSLNRSQRRATRSSRRSALRLPAAHRRACARPKSRAPSQSPTATSCSTHQEADLPKVPNVGRAGGAVAVRCVTWPRC